MMHLEVNTEGQVSITLDQLIIYLKEKQFFSSSISEEYFLNEFVKEIWQYKVNATQYLKKNNLLTIKEEEE